MECRPQIGEAKSKKKRPRLLRGLQKQEKNADTKHGIQHLSVNDLDDNKTYQTPTDNKEESDNKHGENQISEDMRQEQDGTDEEGSEDKHGKNQESEDISAEQDDTLSIAKQVSTDPLSFKDNDNRENRQENATEGSGDESSDSSACSTDSSNGSSSSTENEDKLVTKYPLRRRLKVIGVDKLFKNENGKYEWQWRNENGWDEERKHESTDLQNVLRTRKNEKGFIIKTKNGYRWTLLEEFIIDKDTESIFLDRGSHLLERKAKIIFIGPVGSGKSATINTLLGEDKALSENNLEASSLTKEIMEYNSEYGMLVDTPGLTEEHLPSVLDYLDRNPPDVVVIVFAASRLRHSQKEAIQTINTHLGTYFDKSVLLLTKGGDLLENEHDFINKGNSEEIVSLYCSVGKRCVVFENLASVEEKQNYICKLKDSLQEIHNRMKDASTSVKDNLFEIFGNVRNSCTLGNSRHFPQLFNIYLKFKEKRERKEEREQDLQILFW